VAGENENLHVSVVDYGKRTFCGKCGSVTRSWSLNRVVFCPAGNLDGDFGIQLRSPIRVQDALAHITDELPA